MEQQSEKQTQKITPFLWFNGNIPDALGQCLFNADPAKAQRAMEAMLKMNKIVVKELEEA